MQAYEDKNATVEDRIISLLPYIAKWSAADNVPQSVIAAFITQESGGWMYVMNGGGDGRDADWQSHGDGGTGLFQMTRGPVDHPYHVFDHDRMMGEVDYQFEIGVQFIADCLSGSGGDVRGAAGQYGPHINGAPSQSYGDRIAALAAQYAYLDNDGAITPVPLPPNAPATITDIRDQLPTAPGQGSGRTMSSIGGAVIHYSAVDYPSDRPMLDILTSEANLHIGPYLYEAGLAYHYSIDPQTGQIYQCRDENTVIWHCAAWSNATVQGLGNDNTIAIHVPGGPSLVMSDTALAILTAFVDSKGAEHGFGREKVVSHSELSATQCCGPLIQQFVMPYRGGVLHGESTNPDVPTPPAPHDIYAFTDTVTGHYCAGAFARVYQTRGGLYIFGQVKSEEQQEVCADGVTRTVQWFERARMEFHPEYQNTDYEVELGLLGTEALNARANA